MESGGLAKIAIITYQPTSFISRAFEAQEMVTVSLFSHVGKKMDQVYLKHPIVIAFNELQQSMNDSICAFYNMEMLKWTMGGCYLDQEKKGKYFPTKKIGFDLFGAKKVHWCGRYILSTHGVQEFYYCIYYDQKQYWSDH